MKYYHCMNTACEATFRRDSAKSCPFCGERVLRHAMGREIDEAERAAEDDLRAWVPLILRGPVRAGSAREADRALIPVYAMGA